MIGVKLGGQSTFRGWSSFFVSPYSAIIIGDKASFNSSSYSNHIGLNHRCVFATHTSEAQVRIGDKFGMSSSTINCWKSIVIGNNVRVGANCIITDSDFHLDDPRVGEPKEIVIGDNVWLGANVVILKGVHVGANTIIGMNSIVTKDIPADCIAAGNPCRMLKKLNLERLSKL